MRFDQFTVKAQEALATAQTEAEKNDHPEVTPEHLLAALLAQEGGVVPAAVAKLGADGAALLGEARKATDALPRVQGAQTHVSPRLDAVLKQALREAETLKDQYVSSEHLLLALIGAKNGVAEILKRGGVSRDHRSAPGHRDARRAAHGLHRGGRNPRRRGARADGATAGGQRLKPAPPGAIYSKRG